MNAIRAFNFLFLLGMIGGGKNKTKKNGPADTKPLDSRCPGVTAPISKEFIALNT